METQPTPSVRNIAIIVPPLLSNAAEYFSTKTVTIQVTNLWPHPVVIEDVSLKFQSDGATGSAYIDHKVGLRVGDELVEIEVAVTPTVLFQEHTNYFDVALHYRQEIGGQLANELTRASRERASYLIIKPITVPLGEAFISFKQPEDLKWALILQKYARRAGFEPYLVVHDRQPGIDQWRRIERHIERSKAAFVLWSNRTEWGTGVTKEVELCRQYLVREIVLLADDLPVPLLFVGDIERLRFNPDLPHDGFAKAAETARETLRRSPS
jgi:hypothetical protein